MDSTQITNWRCLTLREFAQKFCVSIQLQMRENGVSFTPVKYTLVFRTAQDFLGHTTHYRVSKYNPWSNIHM